MDLGGPDVGITVITVSMFSMVSYYVKYISKMSEVDRLKVFHHSWHVKKFTMSKKTDKHFSFVN